MALYDDYKTRLAGNLWANARSAVQSNLERDLGKAKVDAGLTATRLQKSSEASNARSAFAAGKASGQKKVFRGKGAGAYGAIGRLDDANLKAASKAQKEVTGLDLLSDRSNATRNAALAATQASTAQSQAAAQAAWKSSLGSAIKLW